LNFNFWLEITGQKTIGKERILPLNVKEVVKGSTQRREKGKSHSTIGLGNRKGILVMIGQASSLQKFTRRRDHGPLIIASGREQGRKADVKWKFLQSQSGRRRPI